jgi:group I intron endonuclease
LEKLEQFLDINFNFNKLNIIVQSTSLGFTSTPSNRLKTIFIKKNISSYKYILEYNPVNPINLAIKQTLNSVAGVYLCINLIDGKIYVGSASTNRMYRRFSSHLLNSKGGNIRINRAVKKYGLENFAFVVIETISNVKNVTDILKIEQKYIDTLFLLRTDYNIAKIAGSVLNIKWSLESKLNRRASVQFQKHLEKLRVINTGKIVSAETKALQRSIALKRTFTAETKKKMSLNNNKSVKIIAYFADSNLTYKEFLSLAEAAEHFFNDRNRRSPIKYALAKNKLILNKYYLRKFTNNKT